MKNLRVMRKAKGLTVRECAASVSEMLRKPVSHAKWTRWEGLATDPDREERSAIADFMGATLDELDGRHATSPQAV